MTTSVLPQHRSGHDYIGHNYIYDDVRAYLNTGPAQPTPPAARHAVLLTCACCAGAMQQLSVPCGGCVEACSQRRQQASCLAACSSPCAEMCRWWDQGRYIYMSCLYIVHVPRCAAGGTTAGRSRRRLDSVSATWSIQCLHICLCADLYTYEYTHTITQMS